MPGTTRRVIVLTAWAVYIKPDLSTLVVDLGLTGLPNVVGIDTVRIVIHGSRSTVPPLTLVERRALLQSRACRKPPGMVQKLLTGAGKRGVVYV